MLRGIAQAAEIAPINTSAMTEEEKVIISLALHDRITMCKRQIIASRVEETEKYWQNEIHKVVKILTEKKYFK